ncbi:RNA polymerase II-associated protein 1 [Engraulis encrasicolus]|uniref:RNA polymerase II-associated protein 1 n=1 Tax=Engraulis encrasicolus TaxID=184585 RepID=UPI002FD5349A
MLRRPKATDSEEDILREQHQLLSSGTSPSVVNVVRRPDKRRGEQGTPDPENGEHSQRDVVTIEDLPDDMPTLTPAPPKKSCFKKAQVRFEEDAEERLDKHDTHISAVLSRIVERDTSTVPVCLPTVTSAAFPKVMHRSQGVSQGKNTISGSGGRKSIFAHQIAAQKAAGKLQSHQTPVSVVPNAQSTQSAQSASSVGLARTSGVGGLSDGPVLVSGQGLLGQGQGQGAGAGYGAGGQEGLKIHQENRARLEGMSQQEILEEQRRLLAQLDPRLVSFVKARKAQKTPGSDVAGQAQSSGQRGRGDGEETPSSVPVPVPDLVMDVRDDRQGEPLQVDMEDEEEELVEDEEETPEATKDITEEDLPFKPQKDWMHMSKLEPEKLEWTKDLPPPRRKGTKKAMQARFDFAGKLIPPTEDLPTHLGLHHHGDEPELAGYSLQELFLLSRSQVTQQRSLALSTLANIITEARVGAYASVLKGSVLATLLDAGLLFLLRFSLDDGVERVMAAAAQALRALLVAPYDEESLDGTFSWLLGMAPFPLLPTAQEEEEEEEEVGDEGGMFRKETQEEKEERKSDHEVSRQDVIKALLKMKVLARVRYILEVVRPAPRVVMDLLEVLIRIARHSITAATQILECPRLMETVMSEFLPTSWAPPSLPAPTAAPATPAAAAPDSLYGLPVAMAFKLLRVLGTAGRNVCARLLHALGAKERLSLLLAVEPSELLLEPGEAISCSTEAFRMWAVAASYGQACNIYSDLYPVLMKELQSFPRPDASPPSNPDHLLPLRLQRAQAILTLLTQVTHTAGCHQELQSALASSQECPPPPPITWGHVTGLQPIVIGQLKGCVKGLCEGGLSESSLGLLPAYLLYLGAFYSQQSRQSCYQPVACLEELESLTADVLLPLISHQALHRLMDNLKSQSALCNPSRCRPGPETVASLPGLSCCGERSSSAGLLSPGSPFPLLTSLCYLLDVIIGLHKGLAKKVSALLLLDSVQVYLRSCAQAMPAITHSTAWLLRHEHHLLYLLLSLARRMVPVDPEVARHASVFHQVALVMLPWLLPGSEYMAHDLLSGVVFNPTFIPEGASGGPEAAALAELHLQEGPSVPPSPPLLGPLLRDACAQLPSLRGCYLTHLAHSEPQVLSSRDRHLGRTPWLRSLLLPELSSGPAVPSDWPFLPLVSLYERMGQADGGGVETERLPTGSLASVVHCLQWLLLLESWREGALRATVPPVAKLARLACVFLASSDLFLEPPVQRLTWALLGALTQPRRLAALDLGVPPPGMASFHDLYVALLCQYEAVSFGDVLFGRFLLLPLQRRYSVTMRLAVFGEHVGLLRSLGVPLQKLPAPLESYTCPPEDSVPLLRLYFRALVTGTLRRAWCPTLYAVAVAHVNTFIFSQEPQPQEVEATRRGLLRKTYYLTDEVLRGHLLLYRLPAQQSELGFHTYPQLPPLRARWLEKELNLQEGAASAIAGTGVTVPSTEQGSRP